MDAKTFIEKHGRDRAEAVAKRAKTNMAYLGQIAGGHRKPSPHLAKRLVAASGGELTLVDLRPDIYSDVGQAA